MCGLPEREHCLVGRPGAGVLTLPSQAMEKQKSLERIHNWKDDANFDWVLQALRTVLLRRR